MERPLELRQFFNPDISSSGGSEHGTRFFRVYTLQDEEGQSVFEAMSNAEPDDRKIKAIKILSDFLSYVTMIENLQLRGDLFWELFLATSIRFYRFAVEDTAIVAEKMLEFITRLYELSKDLNHDESLFRYKNGVIDKLCHLASADYERMHPDSQRIPNIRAITIIQKIHDIDPDLFAMPTLKGNEFKWRPLLAMSL